ncbi:MAG: hypothetical protein GY715_11020 [Planctomycetes bacterium]|nr:hypothetical protein [Planctomycetota bacterium]
MRLVIHILVGLMVAAILGGVAMIKVNEHAQRTEENLARSEVSRFQAQIHLQTTLMAEENEEARPPTTIDPAWFPDNRPTNPLLPQTHPWVEIAVTRERDLLHPEDLIAGDESVASFWYNPFNGIVRARVPHQVSDSRVLELYNLVNDANLTSVFQER